jgi:hypothetical protein
VRAKPLTDRVSFGETGCGATAGRWPVRSVKGKYDAAQTTHENRRHWANADQLSANVDVRRILRSRARYEVANNSYAKGIVATLANYVVGTGPRLQMLTDDPEANRLVEKEFSRWAKAIGLAHKLRTMRVGQCESGGCFGLLTSNPGVGRASPPASVPVTLDLRLIEADQVAWPWPEQRARGQDARASRAGCPRHRGRWHRLRRIRQPRRVHDPPPAPGRQHGIPIRRHRV